MITIGWRSYTIEVNVWNPVYAFAPLILLSISIPLAIFATITTTIAFFLLFCRVFVVYIELVVAIVGAWLSPEPPKKLPLPVQHSPTASTPAPLAVTRHRQLYSSLGISIPSQNIVVPAVKPGRLDISNGMLQTTNTSDVPRDYEGVGGWRTPGNDDEEALWMGMNSRLQLPGESPARRHHRSQSGETSPMQHRGWSPEASRINLAHHRVKTPVRFALGDEGEYFPAQPITSSRRASDATEPSKNHRRRKSGSSSSSSGLMMADKTAGE
ncbi:hypothetical protein HBI80_093320 [Parastagonospora nodorum]|nr:hypothetical protein HBH52_159170 [Parastagonospora nodorum]KAH4097553.1 hypothetical protein HBH46_159050 [Parastagonospora nodorum]KAH4113927.1 hypothetical protein HBH47_202940 [Parastagonospora nodorum]KAH4905626.1 hypothetical protein HBI80_093320 [Parastagonospora nodorum]KAH5055644.1 hypothetical protein HBH96_126410 [Parastagonospora nodorum]